VTAHRSKLHFAAVRCHSCRSAFRGVTTPSWRGRFVRRPGAEDAANRYCRLTASVSTVRANAAAANNRGRGPPTAPPSPRWPCGVCRQPVVYRRTSSCIRISGDVVAESRRRRLFIRADKYRRPVTARDGLGRITSVASFTRGRSS